VFLKRFAARTLSPLPDVVPNSIPEEPSIEASAPSSQTSGPLRRKLVRRVTSRSASVEPSAASNSADPIGSMVEDIPPPPRKVTLFPLFISLLPILTRSSH